jgi:demethylmenaquinone methyltransferase/2-methoxy-6-polyprenyl-1,4-benzoquinol methylase
MPTALSQARLSAQDQHAHQVQRMFGRIARRYDLMNWLMTGGAYRRWQRETVRRLDLAPGACVLDLGCGTGDIALEMSQKEPGATVIAADFSREMLDVARQRPGAERVHWLLADARYLPFASEAFAGLASGYLLRNVPDVDQALAEQWRVLSPGNLVAALDTTPPRRNWLKPLLDFQLKVVIPTLGRMIAGDAEAYTYLPSSTQGFHSAEALAGRFRAAGFQGVSFARRMLGSIAIHWAHKEG